MVNDLNNNKLDEKIKHSLSNLEAPYEPADWTKMEGMLAATPKSNTINWKLTIGISIVVIFVFAGSFFTYNYINSSKTKDDSSLTPVPQKNENATTLETKPIIKPSAPPQKVVPPAVLEPRPAIVEPEIVKEIIPEKSKEKEIVKNENSLKKESETKEKIKNKKAESDKSKTEKESKLNKQQQIVIMGNEPIFGDMLDSSRGIIGETKEKEETKKAAKKQPEYPIGWNNFMLSNVNPDSLKRYRERMKKDSIK